MKLFCSSKLQKQLECKFEKTPAPQDPLDFWYANTFLLDNRDTVVAVLPELRFCVILWDTYAGLFTDLSSLLVPAIREALHDPLYGIPQSVIDQYLPADTRFELCSTQDRGMMSRMSAVTAKIRDNAHPEYGMWGDPDPDEIRRSVNDSPVSLDGSSPIFSWQAVKKLLQQRYGAAVPAMELEVSLDLQLHTARRTLLVPAEISFVVLHSFLEAAFSWGHGYHHQFILPPVRDRTEPLHVLGDTMSEDMLPDGPYVWDAEARLSEQLQEGDRFQYRYLLIEGGPWTAEIQVKRCIPATEEKLPLCTLSEGYVPPEWVEGVSGYQRFRQILQNPEDPEYSALQRRLNQVWSQPVCAERINARLRCWVQWFQDF